MDLNVKIPTMTSATTPSGICFTSASQSNYPVWQAFDGNETSRGGSANAAGAYLGYQFTSQILAKKVYINIGDFNANAGYKIQSSIDGTNYVDLVNSITQNPSTYSLPNNNTKYNYYRWKQTNKNGAYSASVVFTLQVYGREDV